MRNVLVELNDWYFEVTKDHRGRAVLEIETAAHDYYSQGITIPEAEAIQMLRSLLAGLETA